MLTPFRTAAVTTEQVVSAKPCFVVAIRPDLTTTGTITLRNDNAANGAGGAIMSLSAIGLTQAGKEFHGAFFDKGLTIQQSVASDLSLVVYEVKG